MELKEKLINRSKMFDKVNKTIILLRGLPSSGKTNFAEYIQTLDSDTVICCADDYFENKETGEYNFDREKLGEAHHQCKEKFAQAIKLKTENIVVANTNTSEKEFAFYKEKGEKYGYRVFSLVIENRHGKRNHHEVPESTINIMGQRLKKSIKLR